MNAPTMTIEPSTGASGSYGGTTSGVQMSVPGRGNSKPSGSTPSTVCGWSFSTTGAPMTAGSEANRLVQARWLSSTTRCAPSTASASVKTRPRRGVVRSNGKRDGVTAAPNSVIGPSGPFQTKPDGETAASCSNDRASSHSRRSSVGDSMALPGRPNGACPTLTIASESGYGNGRSSSPLTMLKVAALAPIPTARMITAARVKPGRAASCRPVCRKSPGRLIEIP